jgi:hypothetical protein
MTFRLSSITRWPARPHAWGCLVLCAALLACQVRHSDLERWASTQSGQTKLVAVMSHAKYGLDLRVGAALTLVTMKPRGGRRVGIDTLLETVGKLPEPLRQDAVPALVERLIEGLSAAPPKAGEPDATIPFKDAAFGLLNHENPALIADPALRTRLEDALIAWAMADFIARLDVPMQRVSMQQLLTTLGPRSVVALPALIQLDTPKLDQFVRIIAEVGDDNTKREAAERIVLVAAHVASPAWFSAREKELTERDPEATKKAGPEALKKHLTQQQEEEAQRAFAYLKRLGQQPSITFLLQLAASETPPEKLRASALAALEGHFKTPASGALDGLFAIAGKTTTPDLVRGLALLRIGEAPREQTAPRLYQLIAVDSGQVRPAAAELLLGISKREHVAELLQQLAKVEHLSVGEPLRYGRLLGAIEGIDVEVLDSYIKKRNAPVTARLIALGYYYAHGTNAQTGKFSGLAEDDQPVPECKAEDKDCNWRCGEQEAKTVGDFFRYCVEPHMAARSATPDMKNAPESAPKASQEAGKTQ